MQQSARSFLRPWCAVSVLLLPSVAQAADMELFLIARSHSKWVFKLADKQKDMSGTMAWKDLVGQPTPMKPGDKVELPAFERESGSSRYLVIKGSGVTKSFKFDCEFYRDDPKLGLSKVTFTLSSKTLGGFEVTNKVPSGDQKVLKIEDYKKKDGPIRFLEASDKTIN